MVACGITEQDVDTRETRVRGCTRRQLVRSTQALDRIDGMVASSDRANQFGEIGKHEEGYGSI
jgi:hypothetical protein